MWECIVEEWRPRQRHSLYTLTSRCSKCCFSSQVKWHRRLTSWEIFKTKNCFHFPRGCSANTFLLKVVSRPPTCGFSQLVLQLTFKEPVASTICSSDDTWTSNAFSPDPGRAKAPGSRCLRGPPSGVSITSQLSPSDLRRLPLRDFPRSFLQPLRPSALGQSSSSLSLSLR